MPIPDRPLDVSEVPAPLQTTMSNPESMQPELLATTADFCTFYLHRTKATSPKPSAGPGRWAAGSEPGVAFGEATVGLGISFSS